MIKVGEIFESHCQKSLISNDNVQYSQLMIFSAFKITCISGAPKRLDHQDRGLGIIWAIQDEISGV